MFTILSDAHASSICINCLTEEQLEEAYSETHVGCCDECGTVGNPALKPVIVALDRRQIDIWARYRGITDYLSISTADGNSKDIEGHIIHRDAVILLPTAEEGLYLKDVEEVLLAKATRSSLTGTISNFQMNIQVNHNFRATAQQMAYYNKLVYGIDPGQRTAVIATGVTT